MQWNVESNQIYQSGGGVKLEIYRLESNEKYRGRQSKIENIREDRVKLKYIVESSLKDSILKGSQIRNKIEDSEIAKKRKVGSNQKYTEWR